MVGPACTVDDDVINVCSQESSYLCLSFIGAPLKLKSITLNWYKPLGVEKAVFVHATSSPRPNLNTLLGPVDQSVCLSWAWGMDPPE